MNKKGISAVIGVVILITLVLATAAILWGVYTGLVREKLDQGEACFNVLDKVYIESEFTCYDKTAQELKFFIGRRDIDVDAVIVSVSGDNSGKSFRIPEIELSGLLRMYDEVGRVYLPEKNAGVSYVLDLNDLRLGNIFSVKVAPIINEKQCEVSDSYNDVQEC